MPQEYEDYYKNLKDEAYKTMLSKEVQAANAKDQAFKYANTGLGMNGFGTQGVSESSRLGIANEYSTALRDAQNQYDNQMLNIGQQQRQEELNRQNQGFESLTTLMSGSSSLDQLNETLGTYGYLSKGEDGQYAFNQDKLNGLDENTRNQLVTLYNMYSSELQNSDFLKNQTINGNGFRDSGSAIQNVATSDGKLDRVSNALKYIFSEDFLEKNKVENGYTVKLVNKNDDNSYVYMIYRNGAWYQTTANVYTSAKENQKQLIKR